MSDAEFVKVMGSSKYLEMLDMNEEELINLQKLNPNDKIVNEYCNKVFELNKNIDFINVVYEDKEKEYEFNTRLELAREESFSKGLLQGKKETRLKNAKSLLRNGVNKDIVVKSLKLTKEEIKSLGI